MVTKNATRFAVTYPFGAKSSQACPVDLPSRDLECLARQTRGLNRTDIERAVQSFLETCRMPMPRHPTNTCDPYTGNWQEQLIDPVRAGASPAIGRL